MFEASDASGLSGRGILGAAVGAFSPGRCPLLIRTVVSVFGNRNLKSQFIVLRSYVDGCPQVQTPVQLFQRQGGMRWAITVIVSNLS
jgi:hypothetical protein